MTDDDATCRAFVPVHCTLPAWHDGPHDLSVLIPPDIARAFSAGLDDVDAAAADLRRQGRRARFASIFCGVCGLVNLGMVAWQAWTN